MSGRVETEASLTTDNIGSMSITTKTWISYLLVGVDPLNYGRKLNIAESFTGRNKH